MVITVVVELGIYGVSSDCFTHSATTCSTIAVALLLVSSFQMVIGLMLVAKTLLTVKANSGRSLGSNRR